MRFLPFFFVAIFTIQLHAQQWTELKPSGDAPVPRGNPAAIYDPIGHRLIAFGGRVPGGQLNDVWAFYNIAVAYQHGLRRPDEAVVHWENYLASAEPRAEAYAHLIAALKSLGRREQVERWTQISSAKFPDHAQPR